MLLQDLYAYTRKFNFLIINAKIGILSCLHVHDSLNISAQYFNRCETKFLPKYFLFFLVSGTYDGCIYHHDVRLPRHCLGTLFGHSSIVCGLTWSPDNLHLASGGNDNIVNVWDLRHGPSVKPLHSFASHKAAIKVRFCGASSSFFHLVGGIRQFCVFQ